MNDTIRPDDWRSLCEQASKESDPQELMELLTRINRALGESLQRNRSDEASFTVVRVLLPTSSRHASDRITSC